MSEEIRSFLSTFGEELRSKVSRLDNIIGRDHWLSVGTYKESLVRNFLRSTLPKRFEVSTGFLLSKDFHGNLVKSRQIDILIWDSANYSAIFRDGEFVIVPPEACRIVIEVKGRLKLSEIEESIDGFDQLTRFLGVEFNQGFKIARYVFAFDLAKGVSFPESILRKAAKVYQNSKTIRIADRTNFIRSYISKEKFIFDGIFVLGHGFVTADFRSSSTDEMKIIIRSFETERKEYIYSIFETEVQANLGQFSSGNSGMWYVDQPGLLAVKNTLKAQPTKPKSIIIVPKIRRRDLYKDFDKTAVLDDSFTAGP